MSTFTYHARTPSGEEVVGRLRAPNVSSVRARLLDRELVVESVDEKRGFLTADIGKGKVKRSEVMHLARQLAAFVRTGVPLLEAIEVIAEESPNPAMRRTLRTIIDALRSGWTFSDALGTHRRIFPTYLVAAVRSAELTGRLDTVLEHVARYMERDLEARRKVKAALTYPAVILALSVVTVGVLAGFVLPRFRAFFSSFDAELPLTTKILLNSASFVGAWWWALMIGFAGIVFASVWFARSARGRAIRDRVILRLPVIGRIVKYTIAERFCRMLGSMISAGVPLPDAMSTTAAGTGNTLYQDGLMKMRDEMIMGEGFARPLARTGLFPGAINQIVRVGEDTGSLPEQLESAASFYEVELDFSIKRMTSLFEPLAIVGMALMVGFVALAMVQAMYGVLNQVGAA